jgi:hypothetical protein
MNSDKKKKIGILNLFLIPTSQVSYYRLYDYTKEGKRGQVKNGCGDNQ